MKVKEPVLPDRFLYCNCGGLVAITVFPVKKETGYSNGIHLHCKKCKKEWTMYNSKNGRMVAKAYLNISKNVKEE